MPPLSIYGMCDNFISSITHLNEFKLHFDRFGGSNFQLISFINIVRF